MEGVDLGIELLRSPHSPGRRECETACSVEESVVQGLYEWSEEITHSLVVVFIPLKRSSSDNVKSSAVVATLWERDVPERRFEPRIGLNSKAAP